MFLFFWKSLHKRTQKRQRRLDFFCAKYIKKGLRSKCPLEVKKRPHQGVGRFRSQNLEIWFCVRKTVIPAKLKWLNLAVCCRFITIMWGFDKKTIFALCMDFSRFGLAGFRDKPIRIAPGWALQTLLFGKKKLRRDLSSETSVEFCNGAR